MAAKLFVGSLPPDLTNDELAGVFGTYGTTSDVHIMGGKSTSGQACAFVVFDNAESATNAIAGLNGIYSFREGAPPISVAWARQGGSGRSGGAPPLNAVAPPSSLGGGGGMGGGNSGMHHQPYNHQPPHQQHSQWGGHHQPHAIGAPARGPSVIAPPSSLQSYGHQESAGLPLPPPPSAGQGQRVKLFVGNLPTDIQPDSLQQVFGTYGTVTNVHIMQGKSKSGQACAFIEYSSAFEADTAILTLHEKYEIRPGEGNILVKYANSQGHGRSSPY